MINARYFGCAICHQSGENQGHARPQVRSHYRRCREFSHTADDSAISLQLDVRAHSIEFERVHKAVLENRLGDDADTVCYRHQYHHLRLKIGGKSWIRQRGNIDTLDLTVAFHSDSVLILRHHHTRFPEFDEKRLEMVSARPFDHYIAARERAGDYETPGLDPVWDNLMRQAV